MIPFLLGLENLDRQRDDLHEHIALFAKFAGDRTEDTGALGGSVLVDEDDSVVVEADGGTIPSLIALLDADDDALDDFGLLDLAVGDGILDGADDDVSDGGVPAEAAAEHTEDPDGSGAGVVGDHQVSFVLDHALLSLLHDLDEAEALVMADRAAFLEHHDIADLGFVLAIVDFCHDRICKLVFDNLDAAMDHTDEKNFLSLIEYGNQNINSAQNCYWLESSLTISPVEQVELLCHLKKMIGTCLKANVDTVMESMFIASSDGKSLYGKTGTGRIDDVNINGWFVGFITSNDNDYFFRHEYITF